METSFRVKRWDTRVLSATTILGDIVVNQKGKTIGTLAELMIDLQTGTVRCAVLSIGSDLFTAIPWDALAIDTIHKRLILNVDEALLEEAPRFGVNNWPNIAEWDWTEKLHQHFGFKHPQTRNEERWIPGV